MISESVHRFVSTFSYRVNRLQLRLKNRFLSFLFTYVKFFTWSRYKFTKFQQNKNKKKEKENKYRDVLRSGSDSTYLRNHQNKESSPGQLLQCDIKSTRNMHPHIIHWEVVREVGSKNPRRTKMWDFRGPKRGRLPFVNPWKWYHTFVIQISTSSWTFIFYFFWVFVEEKFIEDKELPGKTVLRTFPQI